MNGSADIAQNATDAKIKGNAAEQVPVFVENFPRCFPLIPVRTIKVSREENERSESATARLPLLLQRDRIGINEFDIVEVIGEGLSGTDFYSDADLPCRDLDTSADREGETEATIFFFPSKPCPSVPSGCSSTVSSPKSAFGLNLKTEKPVNTWGVTGY